MKIVLGEANIIEAVHEYIERHYGMKIVCPEKSIISEEGEPSQYVFTAYFKCVPPVIVGEEERYNGSDPNGLG